MFLYNSKLLQTIHSYICKINARITCYTICESKFLLCLFYYFSNLFSLENGAAFIVKILYWQDSDQLHHLLQSFYQMGLFIPEGQVCFFTQQHLQFSTSHLFGINHAKVWLTLVIKLKPVFQHSKQNGSSVYVKSRIPK